MPHEKDKRDPDNATPGRIKEELVTPRMAKSATITQRHLDTARVPVKPNTTLSGIIDKIVPDSRRGQLEWAQIAVEEVDHRYWV